MSRIGRQPVSLPAGVTVDVGGSEVSVKGPKGQLTQAVVSLVNLSIDDNSLVVQRANESRQARANHGLMRSLVQNMVTGVSTGFTKRLDVIGIGYRAEVQGRRLVMQLGYSHPIEYDIPKGIDIAVEKNTKITISGIDKQAVGQVAAVVRGYREPDSYKGKGIRYEGEYVRIKAGKSS